ncbi:MAG: ribosome silencing factor [Bacillota bacterium]
MDYLELKDRIITILDDKIGGDIVALDISEQTSIADYFVVATGKNTSHVRALVESLEEKLEAEGVFCIRKEGVREGRWAVVDYGSIIVHIFNNETRDFYALEKLWTSKNQ